jgi:hypothetical protein
MDASRFLEGFVEELGKISMEISRNLARVMQEVNQMAIMALLHLKEIEDRCKVLIEDVKNGGNSLFGGKTPDVTGWELPTLIVGVIEKCFFKIEGLSQHFLEIGNKQFICLAHGDKLSKSLKCERFHCTSCLLDCINSGIDVCPCGYLLSLKEKHQIMKS